MADHEKKEKDMEKEYNQLKEKHALPELSELDKEFAIGQLESSNFVLRSVVIKMAERTDFVLKILNSMIQPENRIADMQEASTLSASDRDKVTALFKKLSYYEKEFLIVEFDYSEAFAASTIKKFHDEWKGLKPDFITLLKSMQATWKSAGSDKGEYSYFG